MTNLTQRVKGRTPARPVSREEARCDIGPFRRFPAPAADPPVAPVAAPFVKWAGGKAKLAGRILPLLGQRIRVYREPFVGGGAIFWALAAAKARGEVHFERAVLSDANAELVNVYIVVRGEVDGLLAELTKREIEYRSRPASTRREYYEHQRARRPATLSPIEAAARFLFLNRTCFNGLYRVNSAGHFNVPMGRYTNPTICNAPLLRACARALRDHRVEIRHEDVSLAVMSAGEGDAMYLDPPYVPASRTANFTSYTKDPFDDVAQHALALRAAEAVARGARVVLSNSDSRKVRALYRGLGFRVQGIRAARSVGAAASTRGTAKEILASAGPVR